MRLRIRVSTLFLALYLHYGFFSFMPLWLKHIGAPPREIGVLMAIPLVLRLITVAPFSAWAGRRGKVRDAIAGTALLAAILICGLLAQPAYAGRIAIVVAFSIVWDQLPVLTDAYAVMAARSRSLDFGRMRVWGSIGAVVSTASAGWIFELSGIEWMPLFVGLLLLLPVMASPLLPRDAELEMAEGEGGGKWSDVVANPAVIRAMIAAALVMGSHGVLTNFAAIQWSQKGISTGTIGMLQALAVSAEIAAFWFGARLLGERDPIQLIFVAALAATARWVVLAADPGLPVLIFIQLLQGVTATGAILGAMLVIGARVPIHASAAAQGLYAVILGVALAVTTVGSGYLWNYGPAASYLAMAILAGLGIAIAWPQTGRPRSQAHSDTTSHRGT